MQLFNENANPAAFAEFREQRQSLRQAGIAVEGISPYTIELGRIIYRVTTRESIENDFHAMMATTLATNPDVTEDTLGRLTRTRDEQLARLEANEEQIWEAVGVSNPADVPKLGIMDTDLNNDIWDFVFRHRAEKYCHERGISYEEFEACHGSIQPEVRADDDPLPPEDFWIVYKVPFNRPLEHYDDYDGCDDPEVIAQLEAEQQAEDEDGYDDL